MEISKTVMVDALHSDLLLPHWPEWPLVDQQYDLLESVIQAVRKSKADHLSVLFPLLAAVAESTATLRELVRRHATRDAYVIARVVYETAINACFILTNGTELATRAHRHATQRALSSRFADFRAMRFANDYQNPSGSSRRSRASFPGTFS